MDHDLLQRKRYVWLHPLGLRLAKTVQANALGIFSPPLTLITFAALAALRGQRLDVETAFTTMAILGMVTHPANMVMTMVPRAVSALAGFDRMQSYLLQPHLEDHRNCNAEILTSEKKVANIVDGSSISVKNLSIGSTLTDVSFDIQTFSIAVITGRTGGGKTSLLRTLLGEIPPTKGSVNVSTTKVAYCCQDPWLPSGSIREVISGSIEPSDEAWYSQVIDACCLGHDLEILHDGSLTQVGDRGLNLSGGQRQRIVSILQIRSYQVLSSN